LLVTVIVGLLAKGVVLVLVVVVVLAVAVVVVMVVVALLVDPIIYFLLWKPYAILNGASVAHT
jgi:hypothetical protein